MTRRNEDLVHEPGDYLTLAVRALARLRTQVPADTAAAHYCQVTLANLGHLENALREARLIGPPARGQL